MICDCASLGLVDFFLASGAWFFGVGVWALVVSVC